MQAAKIVRGNNIKFIGASSNHIKMIDDKFKLKIAKKNGLPIIEGSEGKTACLKLKIV